MLPQPGYWSEALERRRQVLLDNGSAVVHPGNADLYTQAIGMASRNAVGEAAEVQTLERLVLVRLPGEQVFANEGARLSAQAQLLLGELAAVLRDYALCMLEISGHTDNTGTARDQQALSLLRAAAVAEFLEGQGIQPARFVSEGRADAQPLGDNATPQGRRLNRRVELRIVPLLPSAQHGRPEGIPGAD